MPSLLTYEEITLFVVIPIAHLRNVGRDAIASPESITTNRGYGFRAWPFGPSRNDEPNSPLSRFTNYLSWRNTSHEPFRLP